MLEAYLPKPVELLDETGVPQGRYKLGTIKSVSDKQRMCYITTTGRAADFTAKANVWRDVRCDYATGRMWLCEQAAQFDPHRGGYVVPLAETLVGQRVYFQADQTVRKADTVWVLSWFLVDVYSAIRGGLNLSLVERRWDYDRTPIYSVTSITRRTGEPVCDPVSKKFVFPEHKHEEVIFKGNDLDKMQTVVSSYWPPTHENDIVIHNLGLRGETRQVCSCLPWNPSIAVETLCSSINGPVRT